MHAWIIESNCNPDFQDREWIMYKPLLAFLLLTMTIKNLTHSTKYLDLSNFTLKTEKENNLSWFPRINNFNFRESVNAHEQNSALYSYTPDIYHPCNKQYCWYSS